MWIGSLYLLQNLGVIRPIDLSIIWPVALIIVGLALKHVKHSMTCAIGGNCGECGKGMGHKCEGPDCGTCKK